MRRPIRPDSPPRMTSNERIAAARGSGTQVHSDWLPPPNGCRVHSVSPRRMLPFLEGIRRSWWLEGLTELKTKKLRFVAAVGSSMALPATISVSACGRVLTVGHCGAGLHVRTYIDLPTLRVLGVRLEEPTGVIVHNDRGLVDPYQVGPLVPTRYPLPAMAPTNVPGMFVAREHRAGAQPALQDEYGAWIANLPRLPEAPLYAGRRLDELLAAPVYSAFRTGTSGYWIDSLLRVFSLGSGEVVAELAKASPWPLEWFYVKGDMGERVPRPDHVDEWPRPKRNDPVGRIFPEGTARGTVQCRDGFVAATVGWKRLLYQVND